MLSEKTPEEFDNTTLGLYRLSELILSFLEGGNCGRFQVADLAKAYSKIIDACEFLVVYEQAHDDGNENLAHECGIQYSELVADVQDLMSQLEEDGIAIRLH